MLSSKIRIDVCPRELERLSESKARFYKKYASVTMKTLRKPLFQKFLHWMLRRENIEEQSITNVNVMTFPFQKENGKRLAGKYNKNGEIFIYPKPLKFCQKLIRNFGKEKVYSYLKKRAIATLIHELLHVKYSSEEGKVRELTKKYFSILTQRQDVQSSSKGVMMKMLFA